jgi:hypothetical protein
MARAKATTIQQEMEIRRCVALGITSPKQIYRHLEAQGLLAGDDWVSEKTVARRIREFAIPHDESGPWSLADADPDEAALTLDVLAMLVSPPFLRWPTKDLASRIARVRTACPDIPANWAFELADAYRWATAVDRYYVDMALVLHPWASESDSDWFVHAAQYARTRLGPPGDAMRAIFLELLGLDLRRYAGDLRRVDGQSDPPPEDAPSMGVVKPQVTTPIPTPKPLDSPGRE